MLLARTPLKLLIILLAFAFGTERAAGLRHRHSVGHENKQRTCYGRLGCFSILPPFSPKMPLPMSPKKIQTEYYLRTRLNPDVNQPLAPTKQNLTQSNFNASKPTKILIHGYVLMEMHLAKWVTEVTEEILKKEDVNVIQINWVKGAGVAYDNAVSNTRVVGAQVAYLIKMLTAVKNATTEDFHVIGFSLGAHVAGFAGKKVQESGKQLMVGRITGLDPANPGFDYDDPQVRLDKTDATFVDVIHTDTHTALGKASGLNRELGHIDFYPNGGSHQKGCHSWSRGSSWMKAVTDSMACDHLRAPQLFKYSINATEHAFNAYKCKSWDQFQRGMCFRCKGRKGIHRGRNRCRQMGYWATPLFGKKNHVNYYLTTSGHPPFTAKHYQVQFHWRNHTEASPYGFKAKLFITLHGSTSSTPELSLNDGATFHVLAGKTSRFMVSLDTEQDIGPVQRVTFRWEQPSCWNLFFNCHRENVRLKRVKIFDAAAQKRTIFLPTTPNAKGRSRTREVPPDTHFELTKVSYEQPERGQVIIPSVVPVPTDASSESASTLPPKGSTSQ